MQALVAAVVIFVVSQLIQRLVLDPWSEQRKVIGEIAGALLYLGNFSNVAAIRESAAAPAWVVEPEEAVRMIRSLAARLRASLWTIPFYRFWAFVRLVPRRDVLLSTSKDLVGWSNSIYSGEPTVYMSTIARSLRLPSDY